MARADKAAAVEALKEQFNQASAAVLTEYRGLSVADLKALRRSLGQDATYAIAKNTLTKIAAREAGVEGLDDQLSGPTAIAFVFGDVATTAKGLRDFAKANPHLVIKGGVMEGKILDAETVKKLADLESREVLLAKLAGAMKGNLSKAVGLFAAPLSQAARLVKALEDQKQDA
ncbi:MAG: 50S ribosomal protein L10 [Propionibacteriaceae bacterium]|jgi:large subunit ribosomal protein L10|nr:50S ribosomal protein L10 [Propionibacteriaceae bacterium]